MPLALMFLDSWFHLPGFRTMMLRAALYSPADLYTLHTRVKTE